MRINLEQAKAIVEWFGGEDAIADVMAVKKPEEGHSGAGVYVGSADYPEDGSDYLGPEPICIHEHTIKL